MIDNFAFKQIKRRGLMLVLSSPSGAGKNAVLKRLMEVDTLLSRSISVTTRPPRPGEVNGQHYQFVDQTDFDLMVNRDQLLEYAKVFGHSYGTPRFQVEKLLMEGRDVLFDIDWQGTQSLAQKAPDDLVSIFILPAKWGDVEHRIYSRTQDVPVEINRRITRATEEMSHWQDYDYVIVNTDMEQTMQAVHAILLSERLKRRRQIGLSGFVENLPLGL